MATDTEAMSGPLAGLRALVARGSVALVLALVVNGLVTFAAGVAGVAPGLEELSYGSVFMLTTAGVVGATATYGLLALLFDDPDLPFVAVAAVVLLVSLIPDFTFIPDQPGGSLAAGVVLGTMHVTTAVIAVAALTGRLAPSRF